MSASTSKSSFDAVFSATSPTEKAPGGSSASPAGVTVPSGLFGAKQSPATATQSNSVSQCCFLNLIFVCFVFFFLLYKQALSMACDFFSIIIFFQPFSICIVPILLYSTTLRWPSWVAVCIHLLSLIFIYFYLQFKFFFFLVFKLFLNAFYYLKKGIHIFIFCLIF